MLHFKCHLVYITYHTQYIYIYVFVCVSHICVVNKAQFLTQSTIFGSATDVYNINTEL